MRIDFGADDDGNGVLDASEIDATAYACDGASGAEGSAGTAGTPVAIALSDEPAGDHCAAGGTRIDVGTDDDGDGVLDSGEIDATSYVCDGADDTTADTTVLLATATEPAGTACASGGTRIDAGVDDDADGTLDADEIDSTTYVCLPAPNCWFDDDGDGYGDAANGFYNEYGTGCEGSIWGAAGYWLSTRHDDCDDATTFTHPNARDLGGDGVDSDCDGDDGGNPTFAGTVTYVSETGGTRECDAEIALTGTSYTGECNGCTFGFDIDATISRDDSTADCALNPYYTWIPTSMRDITQFTYWEHVPGTGLSSTSNVESSGVGYYYLVDYGYGVEYPTTASWGDFASDLTMEVASGTVNWDMTIEELEETPIQEACSDYTDSSRRVYSEATTLLGAGDLPCDGVTVDHWMFTLATPTNVDIRVDSPYEATATMTSIDLVTPDGCTTLSAFNNTDCTEPVYPGSRGCPAFQRTLDAGRYEVYVSAVICASERGHYRILANGAALSFVEDDVSAYETRVVGTTTIHGSGTITE